MPLRLPLSMCSTTFVNQKKKKKVFTAFFFFFFFNLDFPSTFFKIFKILFYRIIYGKECQIDKPKPIWGFSLSAFLFGNLYLLGLTRLT